MTVKYLTKCSSLLEPERKIKKNKLEVNKEYNNNGNLNYIWTWYQDELNACVSVQHLRYC